ncbi:MAG: TSCPD domain-containing protein, partial [bacterium]|nr:TSCPD domain-containing protein [bacterium]
REVQVLNRGKAELPAETRTVVAQPKRKRPDVLTGKTIRITTGCGSMYVTINEDLNGPFELFSTIGKAGGCAASQSEAIGRLISLAWRSGIKPEEIEKELIGINCHKPTGLGRTRVTSCPDAMAKAIKKYLNSPELTNDLISYSGACPECGGQVEPESGCAVCRNCGFSECG